MPESSVSKGREFYNRQIGFLVSKDVDSLIESHYNEDSELISFDFVIKGKAALKKHFKEYLGRLGKLELLSTDKFVETEDTVFFEASVRTNYGEVKVYDAFYLKDGKISKHFTGVI